MALDTYIVKAYTRAPIPTPLDLTVIDIIRSAIENRHNIFFYARTLNRVIEFKFQQVEGGSNPDEIVDVALRNLVPYNIMIDTWEIERLEGNKLKSSSDKTAMTNIFPMIAGTLIIIAVVITAGVLYKKRKKKVM